MEKGASNDPMTNTNPITYINQAITNIVNTKPRPIQFERLCFIFLYVSDIAYIQNRTNYVCFTQFSFTHKM